MQSNEESNSRALMSDESLLSLVRDGDDEAYDILTLRHTGAARAYAAQLAGSAHADGLVNDALSRVYDAVTKGYAPRDSFRAFLNATIRDLNARSWGSGRATDPSVGSSALTVADPRAGAVASAFFALAPRQREALWRSEVEGASTADLAKDLGVRPAQAIAAKVQAKNRFAQTIKEIGEDPIDGDDPQSHSHIGRTTVLGQALLAGVLGVSSSEWADASVRRAVGGIEGITSPHMTPIFHTSVSRKATVSPPLVSAISDEGSSAEPSDEIVEVEPDAESGDLDDSDSSKFGSGEPSDVEEEESDKDDPRAAALFGGGTGSATSVSTAGSAGSGVSATGAGTVGAAGAVAIGSTGAGTSAGGAAVAGTGVISAAGSGASAGGAGAATATGVGAAGAGTAGAGVAGASASAGSAAGGAAAVSGTTGVIAPVSSTAAGTTAAVATAAGSSVPVWLRIAVPAVIVVALIIALVSRCFDPVTPTPTTDPTRTTSTTNDSTPVTTPTHDESATPTQDATPTYDPTTPEPVDPTTEATTEAPVAPTQPNPQSTTSKAPVVPPKPSGEVAVSSVDTGTKNVCYPQINGTAAPGDVLTVSGLTQTPINVQVGADGSWDTGRVSGTTPGSKTVTIAGPRSSAATVTVNQVAGPSLSMNATQNGIVVNVQGMSGMDVEFWLDGASLGRVTLASPSRTSVEFAQPVRPGAHLLSASYVTATCGGVDTLLPFTV